MQERMKTDPKYHAKNADRQRKRYQENPEPILKSTVKWAKKNPEKFRAICNFNYHKKNGNVKLGSKCEICSTTKNLVGHHFDYQKPLEVTTLCHHCHLTFHSKLRLNYTILEAWKITKTDNEANTITVK